MKLYRIQPAPRTDHITSDGTELTQRPYPIVCDGAGNVEGMPSVSRVVGFVRDLARQQVDVSWHEVAAVHVPLSDMVGTYVVVQDRSGNWSTLVTAVESLVVLPDKHRSCSTHCCLLHGCKYGHPDCPVTTREVAQEYPCEHCPEQPVTPAEQASADELLHHLRECVSSLEGPLKAFSAAAPVIAAQLAAMRKSMDELDRKLTHGHPLPGDWNARR